MKISWLHTIASLAIGTVLASPSPHSGTDPVRDSQWHLGFLRIAEAHRESTGAGILVAVIDTGVDRSHMDLTANVLPGIDLTPGAAIVGDDPRGWTDTSGHGTRMAGLIAADGRADGIAPDAHILPVRIKAADREAPGESILDEGVDWAIAHGASIINVSLAGTRPSQDERSAIDRALAADIVVVAGVGNRPEATTVGYPAAYPGVIAAAGVDRNGNHAAVSVTGPQVVLAAPAVDIATTGLNGSYGVSTGTSDATAIISGAAALVRAKFPDLSAPGVIHRLTATADDKGPPGRDDQYGYGVINIVKALTADVPPLSTSPPTTATATRPPPAAAADNGGSRAAYALIGVVIIALLTAGGVIWSKRR